MSRLAPTRATPLRPINAVATYDDIRDDNRSHVRLLDAAAEDDAGLDDVEIEKETNVARVWGVGRGGGGGGGGYGSIDAEQGHHPAKIVPQTNRWVVLAVYVVVGAMQELVWITFSANPEAVKGYFSFGDTPDATIDLLLNWGPITYCIVCPFVMLALTRGGTCVWKVVLAGALLTAVGATLRTLPTVLSDEFRTSDAAVYFLHIGQFLNGMAGPMHGATPSALSAIWFPPEQRTLATSICYLPQVLGPSVGFLIAHLVVTGEQMRVLLMCQAIIAVLAVFAWYMCPPLPRVPLANTEEDDELVLEPGVWNGLRHYFKVLLQACRNSSFLALALSGGILTGVFNTWSSSLADILDVEVGESLSQWLGFAANISNFVGVVAVGPLAEKYFANRMRLLIFIFYFIQILGYLLFALALPIGTLLPEHVIHLSSAALLSVLCLASVCVGAATPLFYELSAELTYPVNEGISAGVISLLDNIFGLILLFVLPNIDKTWDSSIMFLSCFVALVLMVGVRESYNRRIECTKRTSG